jgi:hypothetical protein
MFYQNQTTSSDRCRAGEQFRRLQSQATWRKVWSALTGRDHSLLSLHVVEQQSQVQRRNYVGIQSVPLAKIAGSEGRCDDFDADFRPLKSHNQERWVSVALARQQDVALPAVELVQVQDRYFVRDGHHRISVAKLDGQLEIEAEVTVWHSVETVATGQAQGQAPSASQPFKRSRQRLIQVGRRLVTVGSRLQAGLAASAPALQGR